VQVQVSGDQLPGLPPNLENPLRTTEEDGAEALKDFLKAHGREIQDPRLAWIHLDYVVLAGTTDPVSARLVFSEVKACLVQDSPA